MDYLKRTYRLQESVKAKDARNEKKMSKIKKRKREKQQDGNKARAKAWLLSMHLVDEKGEPKKSEMVCSNCNLLMLHECSRHVVAPTTEQKTIGKTMRLVTKLFCFARFSLSRSLF